MTPEKMIRALFLVAALYDGLLGAVFLFFGATVFTWFQVEPPNHMGYVHFPAALLVVFALLFFNIAQDPGRNINLIPYGIMLKVSYCAVVFFHWLTAGIPDMWKPFAVFDLIFLLLFVWAYSTLVKKNERKRADVS